MTKEELYDKYNSAANVVICLLQTTLQEEGKVKVVDTLSVLNIVTVGVLEQLDDEFAKVCADRFIDSLKKYTES